MPRALAKSPRETIASIISFADFGATFMIPVVQVSQPRASDSNAAFGLPQITLIAGPHSLWMAWTRRESPVLSLIYETVSMVARRATNVGVRSTPVREG